MIINMSGGRSGDTLTVITPGAGITVTVSKDGKSKTKVSGADGVAVFKGLASGEWTVTMTDGSQTATKTATVTTAYSVALTFFSATINVTYPAGSTCTATDGVTTLTAPDTSGTWGCVVPNAGTWVVSLNIGFKETVTIAADGEVHTVDRWHLYKHGDEREYITGGFSSSGYNGGPLQPINPVESTKNSEDIYIYGVGNNQAALAGTKKKIPLVGFSKLVVDQEVTSVGSYAGNNFGLTYEVRANKTSDIISSYHKSVVGRANVSIDISSAQSDAYVVFHAQNISSAKGYVYQAWLGV